MNRIILTLFIIIFVGAGICFADDGLRDYNGISLAKGTFIPVISAQEISTLYCDVQSKVKFIATNDMYLGEINVIPQNSEFYGYIEKLNEPIVGTNASMIIKITKLRLSDGFEMPVKGYIYTNNGNLIGGELSAPASFDKKPSFRVGFYNMTGFVPGATRKMGEHTVIASGADLIIILISPLYITHTVTN
jgi:hypothetical protein